MFDLATKNKNMWGSVAY